MGRLLPATFGGVYLLNPSVTQLERVRAWGVPPLDAGAAFAPDECWGLRRSRLHRTHMANASTRCAHVKSPEGLCVPMASHGQTLGVLCVQGLHHDSRKVPRYLLKVIAEQGAITLSSLRLRDALRVQSIRDPLTGLFNRRFLDETLEREVSGSLRTGSSLSLLMLDLDHFKRFNDSLGHQYGDRALREVALLLKERVRGSDIVCRFGGEELVVVLPSTNAAHAAHLAEEIRIGVGNLIIRHNGEVMGGLSVSIGVSTCPEHARTPEELLRAADAALYVAKRSGRNKVVIASTIEDTPPSRIAASSGDY
jgi:diguanylate cyclase (GGDEF)-like protein